MHDIFFTSDLHLSHENIIKYQDRPFSSVEEMNETLLDNWRSVVKPGDLVYVLGDFQWNMRDHSLLRQFGGNKQFILGNHDMNRISRNILKKNFPTSLLKTIKIRGHKIVLCHYPMRAWDSSFHGSWHLHGHVHSGPDDWTEDYSLDVGVDKWGFKPVAYDTIYGILSKREYTPKE